MASEKIQDASQRKNKLYRLRHSAAHVMAQAVLEMFPEGKLAIGPPIADGFYYDFDLPRPLTDADLGEIEIRMKAIVKKNHKFERAGISKAEARERFGDQPYKLELIEGIEDAEVSLFSQGEFTDLCAGPHVARTKQCKHFKLLSVAGAYWRGDSDRPMLQRIYGTVWPTANELKGFLEMREEAKRRDHRRLGKELDLFSFHHYSPGAIFWHPRGVVLYDELVSYWKELMRRDNYLEIRNPIIYDSALYETSGHWEHYRENMFTLEVEERLMCLKPMNCPDTMLFYKHRKRSYRELPMRVAETQVLHRNELSGALTGMTRVRQFAQDDAHIFCKLDQIQGEIAGLLGLIDEMYSRFDLDYRLYLATRPDDYLGELEVWEQAEAGLKDAMTQAEIPFRVNEGDGTFYGPKIDIYIRDSIGRQVQCATIQLDFQLPERFELEFVGADNQMHRPVVIHRAIFGSFERFIAILLEHLGGVFPTWLAPNQVTFLPINDNCAPFCHELAKGWNAKGLRVHVDDRQEKIGYKIRQAELAKTPYMLVVGEREVAEGKVNVRTYRDGKRGEMSPEELLKEIQASVASRDFDVKLKKLDVDRFVDVEDLDAEEQDY